MINGFYVRPEQRKAVQGYEGLYEVGEDGKVYRNGFVLEPINGMYVNLCKGGVVSKVKICYLVARAFLPNLEGRRYVCHKDGDPRNNRAENLFWDERADCRNVPGSLNAEKSVLRLKEDGTEVVRYRSIREAAQRNGCSRTAIQNALSGKSGKCRGYIWKYYEDESK